MLIGLAHDGLVRGLSSDIEFFYTQSQVRQMFATPVIDVHDVENARRAAAMAPLSRDETFAILTEMERLVIERQRIAAVVANLPTTVAELRSALNELHRLVS